MHSDNKSGAGHIQSVEEWWNEILEHRNIVDNSAAGRIGRMVHKMASIMDRDEEEDDDADKYGEHMSSGDESSGDDDEDEEMMLEGGVIRPLHGVEQIADVEAEEATSSFTYIGTQGALAEADEQEHFVPTKEPTQYDWERMANFVKARSKDAGPRQALEIKDDLKVFGNIRHEFHHLKELVEEDTLKSIRGKKKGKKKKKKVKKMKKGVQAVMAANAAAAMAAGPEPEPEPEVSENPLAGAGVDPDIEPTLDADIETVVPAAKPRRKKKKKTIAA